MIKPVGNSLQAVLNRVKTQTEDGTGNTLSGTKKLDNKQSINNGAEELKETAKIKSVRANTVLIGGHFMPGVAKQLRILAAEEETTNQALLEQALDLLFVKKGKKRIAEL